jgi:hypothetical protein
MINRSLARSNFLESSCPTSEHLAKGSCFCFHFVRWESIRRLGPRCCPFILVLYLLAFRGLLQPPPFGLRSLPFTLHSPASNLRPSTLALRSSTSHLGPSLFILCPLNSALRPSLFASRSPTSALLLSLSNLGSSTLALQPSQNSNDSQKPYLA